MKRSTKATGAALIPPSEALRQAVAESGKTLYRVSKDSGVPYACLHRFVVGHQAVSMGALDKLCVYLGLELTGSK
jgi:hypothetical protein